MTLDPSTITLGAGSHPPGGDAMCVMEAVAYVAGEPWSDDPACACPVIAVLLRRWNDDLPDADRTRLLAPLIPRLVGSRSTPEVEQRRALMALDWLIRVYTPAWLDLVPALRDHAKALRALPEIVDTATARTAAARDAAWDAAWDAARDAARTALAPTVATLQVSALDLVGRMLDVRAAA
jgi:hypothetical protein